jgi:hypothetical protein
VLQERCASVKLHLPLYLKFERKRVRREKLALLHIFIYIIAITARTADAIENRIITWRFSIVSLARVGKLLHYFFQHSFDILDILNHFVKLYFNRVLIISRGFWLF